MTQGGSKLSKTTPKRETKHAKNPKKGKRTIQPKRKALIAQAAQKKELSAKLTRSIEKQAVNAASSGKLTIMKAATMET
ncbi:hypothetical protein FRC19_004882 [Serendipita sp. 401]|nr:hypothetical protein FRC15_007238 [Serendipita sp. 397]KAG8798352.1 hypothetical protein FRC16_007423 [Serendipita sp. 398]KAG8822969.1 hypothetical protein FRC19_004882 [Serendipita sp. 401]KAG8866776.1 hypothetical protein FRC20_007580 [Serendipita sp. 405]